MKKKLHGFSYGKRMANFEAFHWNFLSSTNPQIMRSVDKITSVLQEISNQLFITAEQKIFSKQT